MSRSKEMDLTVGDPFRSLLKFAIPVILGNLFQLCYTLADSVIVGKTLGENSLAAVGATSIIIYFVFCFINGFTGGFGICLGQRFGARDEAGMRKSIAVSTLLSVGFTVILTLICCLGAHRILELMQIPADISGEAYDYMFVVLLGTGATVFYVILGLLAVYRTSIQSMQNGSAPFAACMIELVMRIAATVGLSGILGYTAVCIASPMAWFGACALLIPCYYRMIRKWKVKSV